MSREEIFSLTACEPWAISTLFQLLAMKKADSPQLRIARTLLHMPDLVNYFLTGRICSERSIASTSNLMGLDGEWCGNVINRFELPDIFVALVDPGTRLAPLRISISEGMDWSDVPVIATCGHDTSAVAASIPAEGDDWAFLSCGTWSILGRIGERPIATPECLTHGFGNEYALDGWFTCRNILGLWLIQQLRAKWNTTQDPWDYDRMTAEAEASPPAGAMIDVADPSLLAPPDMETALLGLIEQQSMPAPRSRGELIRCVLESLALEYALALKTLAELTQRPVGKLYMVGGGTANRLLCQLTADACGLPVYAGVDQCTALGNALTQAVGAGLLDGAAQIRRILRNSFRLALYEPRDAVIWEEKIGRYKALIDQRQPE
jgi:rhamnulokinase